MVDEWLAAGQGMTKQQSMNVGSSSLTTKVVDFGGVFFAAEVDVELFDPVAADVAREAVVAVVTDAGHRNRFALVGRFDNGRRWNSCNS